MFHSFFLMFFSVLHRFFNISMALAMGMLVLTGCGSVDQKNEAVEPGANEIFKEMYSAVTVATSANGNDK